MAVHAIGSVAPNELAPAGGVLLDVRVRLCASGLDARLAAGEEPWCDAALARRAEQLVSGRARCRIAAALERVCSERRRPGGLTAAVPANATAVEIARPTLEQLAAALRSGEAVRARGVAISSALLIDGSSALYRPAYRDELHAVAREALLALIPGPAVDQMLAVW